MSFRYSCLVVAFSLLTVNGCQLSTPSLYTQPATGNLRFQVSFPLQSANFQLQAIPQSTNKFTIEIEGQGLNEPIIKTLVKTSEKTQLDTSITGIPVGSKSVTVKAYEDSKLLASGSSSVNIEANLSSRVEIELEPTSEGNIQLKIEGNVPLPLNLSLVLEGEGLSDAQKESLVLSAGQNPVTNLKTTLPKGKKTVSIRLATENPDVSDDLLPALTQTFEIDDNGTGQIVINSEQLVNQYSNLLKTLDAQSLEGLDLAALIRYLLASGKIQEVLTNLSPSILAKLNANPITAVLIASAASQVATPTVSVPPSVVPATPFPFAQPTPLETSSPAANDRFLADIRLAIAKPSNPVLLMKSAPDYKPRIIIPLRQETPHIILQNDVWGVLIRTNQTSTQALRYSIQLKKEDGKTLTPLVQGLLGQRISVKGIDYAAGFIPFISNNTLLKLEANNNYILELEVRHPSGQRFKEKYTVNVPAGANFIPEGSSAKQTSTQQANVSTPSHAQTPSSETESTKMITLPNEMLPSDGLPSTNSGEPLG